MIRYDLFVDTKDKRRYLFLCGGLLILAAVSLTYLITACDLLSMKTNEDLLRMLKENTLTDSYLARVILSCMSLSSFDIGYILSLLVKHLHGLDILFLVWITIWFSGEEFIKKRKAVILILVCYGVLLLMITGIAIHALSSLSLLEVLKHLHWIAYLILIIQAGILLCCTYYLIQYGKEYRKAMNYRAEELLS